MSSAPRGPRRRQKRWTPPAATPLATLYFWSLFSFSLWSLCSFAVWSFCSFSRVFGRFCSLSRRKLITSYHKTGSKSRSLQMMSPANCYPHQSRAPFCSKVCGWIFRVLALMLNGLKTTAQQKCGAVPRRARIESSWIVVSLNSRLESHKEEEEAAPRAPLLQGVRSEI